MSVDTNETTEQHPNEPVEDGPEKMSDVPAADTDGDEIPNATINGPILTSFPSNELTNSLKRPLLNESIDNEEIKKCKITKNNGKELEDNTSLYNKNNFIEHSYVCKETSEKKSDKDTSVNHSIEVNIVGADQKQKTYSQKKKTIYLNNENKPFTKNNDNDKSIPICSQVIQSIPTKGNGLENNQNEHVQNKKNICEITPLNRSRSPSLLDKLFVLETIDSENDNTYDVSMLAGSSGINNKSKSSNIASNLENSVPNETKDVDDSDDDNVVVQEDVSSIDEDDVNETDNNSDSIILEYDDDDDSDDDDDDDDDDGDNNNDDNVEDEDNEEAITAAVAAATAAAAAAADNDDGSGTSSLSDEEILQILKFSKEVSKKNFPLLLKLFSTNEFTFEQFEAFCTQIICSIMTEKYSIGNYRKDFQKLDDREKSWRTKFQIMYRQLRELDSVVKTFNTDLKKNNLARPRIITRTVGLQTNVVSREPSTSDSVDITGDDDDVVTLNTDNIKPNCKPSTSSYNETPTLRKILPLPSVSKQTPVLIAKAVPPALPMKPPINSNENGTIDLTEGDDVNIVPRKLSLEKSPYKIVQRAVAKKNISPGTSSTQLTQNLTTQMTPKNVTYIEVPKMQLSNSNYVMRTTPTITRSSPSTSSMNIPKTTTTSRPFILKHGQLMPIQLSPITSRQLQPVTSSTVTYATHQIPTTQLTGQLQPVPPAIPIALTAHPAPLPGIPNQRSLPTWKKLPPAPKVTLADSTEKEKSKSLVLSWNLVLSNMTADITGYQIYAYHETNKDSPRSDMWKKIGEVNALPLPMACSLTQFLPGERYHFAVRAVDIYTRVGPFSSPQSMFLKYKKC